MKSDKLIASLEMYSNAIVGFIVLQSIGFSFTFGTDASFGCEVTKYKSLAGGLMAHFVLSTVLAGMALRYIARQVVRLSDENQGLLLHMYWAKTAVVGLFAVIPVALLGAFGLAGDPSIGRCALSASSEAVVLTSEPGRKSHAPRAVNTTHILEVSNVMADRAFWIDPQDRFDRRLSYLG